MNSRIRHHPILDVKRDGKIEFHFNGTLLTGMRNEVISSALFAHGIHIFGTHHRDGAPQGIFCANGQCGQCLVLVNDVPRKACVTPIREGMRVRSLEGLPELPPDDAPVPPLEIDVIDADVLIVGGGPAGLSAALEIGRMGVRAIVCDDKQELGGKLSLQTHNFFGSIRDCFAGDRGLEIGNSLSDDVESLDSIEVWLDSPVVGIFSDRKVGIVNRGIYRLVRPRVLLVATGAREKMLSFAKCDLPGIYGAGAFQTLVNRDMIRVSEKLFIVGGGNVGLIAAYQALQAGIEVLGIVEALPSCGGYKVHLDKLKRLGVPIYTSHTVLSAIGKSSLEGIIITEIDRNFYPIPGTEKEFTVDTLLIAVGLSPVDELTKKAEGFGIRTYEAGDAETIAEASAAMFSGRIAGRNILKGMGFDVMVPKEWTEMLDTLRGKPGPTHTLEMAESGNGVYPVIRCVQEIPCNPCTDVCPLRSIAISSGDIEDIPEFSGRCVGCLRCVSICPGLAITVVDRRYDPNGERALVMLPWEMPDGQVAQGMEVVTAGFKGEIIGTGEVMGIKRSEWQNRRSLLAVSVPWNEADHIAGIRMIGGSQERDFRGIMDAGDDDLIICRCERVIKGEIRKMIRKGARDINDLKAVLRVAMGPCAGKTCIPLLQQMFRDEEIDLDDVTAHVERPFTQEVALKVFLSGGDG